MFKAMCSWQFLWLVLMLACLLNSTLRFTHDPVPLLIFSGAGLITGWLSQYSFLTRNPRIPLIEEDLTFMYQALFISIGSVGLTVVAIYLSDETWSTIVSWITFVLLLVTTTWQYVNLPGLGELKTLEKTEPVILACPFCGDYSSGDGEVMPRVQPNECGRAWEVWATCCDFYGPLASTPKEAIAAWNKRPKLPEAQRWYHHPDATYHVRND